MLTDASLFQHNIPFLVSYTGTWNRRNRMGVGVAQNHPSQLASFLTSWIIPENTWWILMDRKHPKQLLPMRCRAIQVLPFLTTTLCSYLPLKKCFEPSVQFHVMKCFTFLLWHLDQTQLHAEFALYYATCPFSTILMKIRLLCRCETESTDQFDFVCLWNECIQVYQNLCEFQCFENTDINKNNNRKPTGNENAVSGEIKSALGLSPWKS